MTAGRPRPPADPNATTVADDSPATPAPPLGPIRVTFRRLAYDFESTIQKIYAIPELDPFLGDRLRQGR